MPNRKKNKKSKQFKRLLRQNQKKNRCHCFRRINMAKESQLDLIDRQALLKKKTEMDLCFAVSEFDINNAPRIVVPNWFPVSDQLPKSGERVIVCRKDGRVEQGVFLGVNGWWKVYGTNTKSVTHWMPLPQPPKGD